MRPRAPTSLTVHSRAIAGGIAAATLLLRMSQKRGPLQPSLGRGRMVPRCRVVVVGAGFGGLQAASVLARSGVVDVTVIDANNYHLFQPLLYQVATSALSARDIANALRSIVPDTPRTRTVMGRVTGIDLAKRTVLVGADRPIPYDRLIVATGSQSSYFGHAAWAPLSAGLRLSRLRNAGGRRPRECRGRAGQHTPHRHPGAADVGRCAHLLS